MLKLLEMLLQLSRYIRTTTLSWWATACSPQHRVVVQHTTGVSLFSTRLAFSSPPPRSFPNLEHLVASWSAHE